MWTPWQMYAWGAVGYLGGALARTGLFDAGDGGVRIAALAPFGFASGLFYGLIINAFDVIAYVRPLTWQGALARFAMALPFDLMHGVATVVFLVALYGPWTRRIARVVRKYGVR